MENLFNKIEMARANKTFTDGLSYYTQSNCQVTLTDNGYRIYRPPNLIHDSSTMHNMWGGMKLTPYNINSKDPVIKGHTYVIKFHLKGKSTNTASLSWTNNMGWGGGGLVPAPTNVIIKNMPANFDGEMDCSYKFTVSDDVWKTCTSSYGSFVAGTKYLSCKDFQFGFSYENTGTLGTDLYITNIRMYDLTEGGQNVSIRINGIVNGILNETNHASISKDGDILANSFNEI